MVLDVVGDQEGPHQILLSPWGSIGVVGVVLFRGTVEGDRYSPIVAGLLPIQSFSQPDGAERDCIITAEHV
jgi:hypothetical protein